jgi:hypothetical protein
MTSQELPPLATGILKTYSTSIYRRLEITGNGKIFL